MTKFQDCLAEPRKLHDCVATNDDTYDPWWPLNPCLQNVDKREEQVYVHEVRSLLTPHPSICNLMLIWGPVRWNPGAGNRTSSALLNCEFCVANIVQSLEFPSPNQKNTQKQRSMSIMQSKLDGDAKLMMMTFGVCSKGTWNQSRHLTRCCENGFSEKKANCLHTLLCKVWLFASSLDWKWCCTRVSCVNTSCLLRYKMHYLWFLASPKGLVPARHNPPRDL